MKSLAPLFLWAGLTGASAEIVINEIHYDPRPKTDRAEFIELFNAGAEPVDLADWHFSDGFTYTFPAGARMEPGAYLILAQNMAGYQRKFGSIFAGGLKAFGEFEEGVLSNEGERIVLRDGTGEMADQVDYGVGFPWPTASQGEPVQDNGDGVSMELLHPSLDNDLGGSWRAARVPTPGKVNSIHADPGGIPPHVRQVEHSPRAPKSGEPVSVSAKVTDPDGVGEVALLYQMVAPGAYLRLSDPGYETDWTEVVMRDDGQAPDAMAGDFIYTATMPDEINQHRHLIRYRIRTSDIENNVLTVPYPDDPQPNFAYFVYDGVPGWKGAVEPGASPEVTFSAETMNSIAVYHLIATNGDIETQQWGGGDGQWFGTVVYGEDVYDHMRFSKRGRASRGQVGKEKWDWNFNRGHRFQARDNYGRPYDVKWREINVLPGTNPWWRNDVSTDGTLLNEPVGFRVFQLIGSPASNTNYFQLRVIDHAAEAPGNQYNGDLWGLYLTVQDPDSRFLSERDLPDGNIYNWHGGGDVQKNQGAGSVTDQSDHRDFKAGLRSSTTLEWWREHLNFDAYYAFNSGNLVINNSDMRPNDNMMSYYHPDGRCHPIPWDLDLTFEDAPHLGRGDTPAWENIYHVLRHPEVDIPYQNRIRELLSLLFNAQQSGMLVDEYARFVWIDVPQGARLAVVAMEKDGSLVKLTTAEAHGFETGDVVTIEGVRDAAYNGDKEITRVSETAFTFKGNLFAPDPVGDEVTAYKTPDAKPLVLMDQAMWDHHPRKRKKGIYYANIPGNAAKDFKGYRDYMKSFLAPGGYGHELLASHSDEAAAPNPPVITYAGADGYPADDLVFEVSAFSGGTIFSPQAFAAVQWRIAETTNPALPDFDPSQPRVYEIDAVWQSDEIAPFEPRQQIPVGMSRPGRHHHVRARMKNTAGHWSRWSDPIQFVVAAPDISLFAESLVITEIMYHPREATEAEAAQGFTERDFEYLELVNRGTETLDLTEVRFTKGIDFDFGSGAVTSLAPGAGVLVVSHAEGFAARYGEDSGRYPIAGVWEGQLSNGGERIKLSYGAGTPIFEFEYNDEEPWPVEADGGGHALVSRWSPGGDPGLSESWAISRSIDGSPGYPEEEAPGGTYAEWRTGIFTPDQAGDEAIAGPFADPDGDGVPNWLEHGQGTHPLAGGGAQTEAFLSPDGSRMTVSHPFAESLDVTVGYEISADLQAWTLVTPSGVAAPEDGLRRASFPRDDRAAFVRMRWTFTPAE